MIIYEVNLTVQNSIIEKYEAWLRKHIEEMLHIHGFEKAETFKAEASDPRIAELCVRYHVKSRLDLENYFEKYAEKMRADGIARFGEKFTATRRILKPTDLN